MSHHLSGPHLRSPLDDARLDLTDLFAFTVPGGRTALIMNVNPLAPSGGTAFHPDAVYRINVDTDGDDRADIAFSFTFSTPADDGEQTLTVHRATGPEARAHEAAGTPLFIDAPVSFGRELSVSEAFNYKVSAGLRSDPFFADLDGILADFQWTGTDWGADKNVFGIALEMPDSELGDDPEIGVWARVSVHQDGDLVSVDRGAHPSLTAYLNADDAKAAYNAGEPADDWATYLTPWKAALAHTGGYTPEAAEEALRTVLPDILRYDRTHPAAYPNGRTLTDDVTSARLAMISNGRIPTDHIGPHTDLLPHFPYLGTPH
ncbi:DUF4331 family protein [Streptomyces sp. NPDC048338]|uniref:DUF4331 family protein n=1 Tax=Streptomyces sp. NPDC048338 TaxID=3365536 RepID=UPI00371D81F5